MIRLIRLLLTGDWHRHVYKILKQVRVEGDMGDYTRYYCRCDVCGKIRKF